jgi:RimJ/RimL family protein N-acetyltransferase
MIALNDWNELLAFDLDIIVPFEVVLNVDGLFIETYDIFGEIAEEFERKFDENWFSKEAIDFVKQKTAAAITNAGYIFDDSDGDTLTLKYSAHNVAALNTTIIRADTVQNERGAFVTIVDGKCVSIAELNPSSCDSAVCDIGVETSETERGKGYAVSNVAALTRFLLAGGAKKVTYHCSSNNSASCKVAEKAGFTLESVEKDAVAFKKAPQNLN